MNVEILGRMTLEGLRKLEAAVKAELEARLDYTMRPGRTAWFVASGRNGLHGDRHVQIERINQKTVSCRELGDSVSPGTQWKVPPGMLRIEPVARHTPLVRPPTAPSKPATQAAAVW